MGTRKKLEGTTINNLYISEYLGDNRYLCTCTLCGNTRKCRTYELTCGRYKACKSCESKLGITGAKIDCLTGKTIGYWKVGQYLGDKTYRCLCTLCNREFNVLAGNLRRNKSRSCVDCANQLKRDKTVNLLDTHKLEHGKILERLKQNNYLCECGGCGKHIIVAGSKLKDKKSVYCINCKGLDKVIDITGKTFGNIQVLERAENRGYRVYYKCKCLLCGREYEVLSYNLRYGHTTSCGCQQLIDLTDKQIFEWHVIEYRGNCRWLCRCSCGTEHELYSYDLRSGRVKSCGCKKWEYMRATLLDRYGELSHNKINNKRSSEQLKAVESRENLLQFIQAIGYKPSTYELSELLGINIGNTLKKIHRFGLEEYIEMFAYRSKQENEVLDYIKQFLNADDIVLRNRTLLKGKEIDIWIPSKKLGIEINGAYWHSTIYKDKNYHKNKSIYQYKLGIRIIHIYEYEWDDEVTREKLKQMLYDLLADDIKKIYARDCVIKQVENCEYEDFTEQYHLHGYANASVVLGCYYDEQLMGLMSFGKPRFNNDYQYEIIRMCWLPGVNVIGGSSKLFKHFIKGYKPESIISYCDIGKFRGDSYVKMGMQPLRITDPNYVWVNCGGRGFDVLSRYQTQKKKLLELGFGTPDMTEVEIMESLGWVQIYDSGNGVFEYKQSIKN